MSGSLVNAVTYCIIYINRDTSHHLFSALFFPFHLFLFLLLYHPHFSSLQFHTVISLQVMCRGKVRQELFILSDIYDS